MQLLRQARSVELLLGAVEVAEVEGGGGVNPVMGAGAVEERLQRRARRPQGERVGAGGQPRVVGLDPIGGARLVLTARGHAGQGQQQRGHDAATVDHGGCLLSEGTGASQGPAS